MTPIGAQVRERRWVVLGTDGRHVTIGRHSDPNDSEIRAAERALTDQGQSGWLAILEGDYWARSARLSLIMVKPLGNPDAGFEDAIKAFKAARMQALRPT